MLESCCTRCFSNATSAGGSLSHLSWRKKAVCDNRLIHKTIWAQHSHGFCIMSCLYKLCAESCQVPYEELNLHNPSPKPLQAYEDSISQRHPHLQSLQNLQSFPALDDHPGNKVNQILSPPRTVGWWHFALESKIHTFRHADALIALEFPGLCIQQLLPCRSRQRKNPLHLAGVAKPAICECRNNPQISEPSNGIERKNTSTQSCCIL